MATAAAAVAAVAGAVSGAAAGAATAIGASAAVAGAVGSVAGTIAGVATGAIIGGVVGGVVSGAVSELTGGSFSDGFKKGLVTGAIAGGVLSIAPALGAAGEAADAATTAADASTAISGTASDASGVLSQSGETGGMLTEGESMASAAPEATTATDQASQTVANVSDQAVAQQSTGGAVTSQSDKFADKFQNIVDGAAANSEGILNASTKPSFWESDFAKTAMMQMGGGILTGLGNQMAQEDQQDELRNAEERGLKRTNAGIASAPSPVSVGLSGRTVNVRRYSNRYSR